VEEHWLIPSLWLLVSMVAPGRGIAESYVGGSLYVRANRVLIKLTDEETYKATAPNHEIVVHSRRYTPYFPYRQTKAVWFELEHIMTREQV
jgi:hypothetical protein